MSAHRDLAGVHLLMFALGPRRLALPTAEVREVIQTVWITPLTKAPPTIEGVVNVRGTLVPVCDVRGRFGIPAEPISLLQHLIIANAGGRTVALRVDRALDVVSVNPEAIERAGGVAPGAQHLAGLAKLTDGLLVIADLERFLSLDEATQLDDAMAGASPVGAPNRRKPR